MNISPLILKDCKRAADLHEQAFFKGWGESAFQEFLQTPGTFGLKFNENQALMGYILWREIMDEAEILTVVVDPSYRRKGVGSLFLKTLCESLKDKGIIRLFLEVAEDNEKALSFYIKHGFIFLSKRPQYYATKGNGYVSALNFGKDLI